MSPTGSDDSAAAFGGGQQPGELVCHRAQPPGDLPVAAPGLEQLVGDGERGQDGGLVALDHRKGIAHPLEGRIEVGRHFARVLGWQLGADDILLAADRHPHRILGQSRHAAFPPP